MSLLKKIIVSLLRILAGVPIVSLLICGLLFLFLGATLKGRSVGLSAVILGGVLYCSVGYWNRKWFKRIRGRFYAVLLPISLLLYVVPMIFAPSGEKTGGCVRNCFLHGQGRFSRYSPWNVIPEIDQLKVGVCLLPFGDPYVDFAKASRMRSLLLPIYDEMDGDADFRALGSALNMAYRELFHMEFHTGHYYLFLPDTTIDEKLPCVIFLHGLGGNIKPCLWVLSRLSKQKKCIVIAPTFGLGNWNKAEMRISSSTLPTKQSTLCRWIQKISTSWDTRMEPWASRGRRSRNRDFSRALFIYRPSQRTNCLRQRNFRQVPKAAKFFSYTVVATSGFRGV